MIKFFLEAFLQVAIILPFAIVLLKEFNKANFQRIAIFVLCYIVYQLILVLPKLNPAFDFVSSSWNWDGKILGVILGIICFYLFKKHFAENNFFTLKQSKTNLRKAQIGATALVILSTVVWYVLGKSKFDIETLAFQLTIPGVDEEIMFRGILLGLLMSALKCKIYFLGNPSVLLTAILFGFMHALTLDIDYSLSFEPVYFIQTGFAGYIWGWVTIKSRSILLAILSHNFSNFFGTLSTMIK